MLHIKIIDDFGNPDALSSLADVIIDKVLEKGVGMFRTENHVAKDLRAAVNELIYAGVVSVHNPTVSSCHNCKKDVHIWHTYADGTVLCTECRPVPSGDE